MSDGAVSVGARVGFGLLGPVIVLDGAGAVLAVGPPRWRVVLAALLIHRGGPLSVQRLISLLWGPVPPVTAATMVHAAIGGLRRVLEPAGSARLPSVLVTGHGGYALRVDPAQVDAFRFEQLLAEGRDLVDAAPAQASAVLGQALALWRGPALDGVEEPFARDAAARWDELRVGCVEERMRTELAMGHHHEVVAELTDAAGRHPLRERLSAQLMHALYRCGRQADALDVYRRLAGTLRLELGLEPGPGVRRLHQAILRQDRRLDVDQPVPARVLGAGPGRGLPAPVSSFVGRTVARAAVTALIDERRLVTLTGTGGAGKTRLAVEIARARATAGPARVWLVELATLRTPSLLEETIAETLGVRPEAGHPLTRTLAAALSGHDTLLVLDNCEHLVEACAALVQVLLGAAEQLRVLVTSREPLGVPGEVVYPVAPLPVTDEEDEDWRHIADCEAVRLFAERAASAHPGFAVTEANAGLVGRVCRGLDGLPMALELAAARVASMPLDQLAARLPDRFTLLDSATRVTEERHRGLSASVTWSYDLLEQPERALLTRLAVFPASFTEAAAADLAAGPDLAAPDVSAVLARLVSCSVVQLEDPAPDGGQARYRLLETIREYARKRLDPGVTATLRGRHARWYLAVAEEAQPRLFRAGSGPWLARLHLERDHFRAALEWSFDPGGDPLLGARLIGCLWHPWDLRGARGEGLHWVRTGLTAITDRHPAERLALLSAGALFCLGRAEFDACTRLAEEQLPLAHAVGAPRWRGQALAMLATVAWALGQFERALPLYRDAVAASLAGGDLWRASLEQSQLARLHRDREEPDEAMAVARRALGHAHQVGEGLACGLALDVLASLEHHRGDLATARSLNDQAQQQYALVGYVEGEASALYLAGHIALASGDPVGAREAFERSLRRRRRIGHREGVALALDGLAEVAIAESDDEAAALLLGASAAVRREIGGPPVAGHRRDHRARLAERLGPVLVEQALYRGAGTTIDELIRRAHNPPREERGRS